MPRSKSPKSRSSSRSKSPKSRSSSRSSSRSKSSSSKRISLSKCITRSDMNKIVHIFYKDVNISEGAYKQMLTSLNPVFKMMIKHKSSPEHFFEALKEKLHDDALYDSGSLYTHMKNDAYSGKYTPVFNLPLSTKEDNVIFSKALEHIMADVLELAAGNTREANKIEMRPKDIKMSIKYDTQLSKILKY